jgi:hypothetical protein
MSGGSGTVATCRGARRRIFLWVRCCWPRADARDRGRVGGGRARRDRSRKGRCGRPGSVGRRGCGRRWNGRRRDGGHGRHDRHGRRGHGRRGHGWRRGERRRSGRRRRGWVGTGRLERGRRGRIGRRRIGCRRIGHWRIRHRRIERNRRRRGRVEREPVIASRHRRPHDATQRGDHGAGSFVLDRDRDPGSPHGGRRQRAPRVDAAGGSYQQLVLPGTYDLYYRLRQSQGRGSRSTNRRRSGAGLCCRRAGRRSTSSSRRRRCQVAITQNGSDAPGLRCGLASTSGTRAGTTRRWGRGDARDVRDGGGPGDLRPLLRRHVDLGRPHSISRPSCRSGSSSGRPP